MDTVFLSFANLPEHPLSALRDEDDALTRLLTPRAAQQHFLLYRDSFITRDKLPSYLTLYRNNLVLFAYSGHAGRDRLLLTDGVAHSEGLAQMLGQCPKLKLVLLNGCSTQGQVTRLLDAGVPVVIATSAPVDDDRAAFFSTRFFESLLQQHTVREAFDMAKGATDTKYSGVVWHTHRDIGSEEATELPDDDTAQSGFWGLFYTAKSEHVTAWKLPVQAYVPTVAATFTPNQHLIDTLFAALAPYNDETGVLFKKTQRGEVVTLAKKRIAVLNALPAPLAEPLRKLMVPVEEENEGYDKISAARLRQIAHAYTTSMELLAFTLLAQVWESFDQMDDKGPVAAAHRTAIHQMLRLTKEERETYDFLVFVRALMSVLESNRIPYFVEELEELRNLVNSDLKFEESLRFLNGLRLQIRDYTQEIADIVHLSQRGEECLTYLYSKTGFLARYKLAAIQGIDVQKFRHQRTPRFDHKTVMLHDLLGGFERSSLNIERSLDNRAILLIDQETWNYLNLSPFVLDENAYQDRAEICKIYFFSHFSVPAQKWFYKYVYKPDDPFWEINAEGHPFVHAQFDAFSQALLQQPFTAL